MNKIPTNYLTSDRFVTGRLVEYDLKAANVSILRHKNILSQKDYEYLLSLPKIDREVKIGKWQGNNYDNFMTIRSGVEEAIGYLIEANQIDDSEIIRIANDAITINRVPSLNHTQFGFLEFRPKLEASNMVTLGGISIFSSYINNSIDIKVIGLGKNEELHENGMLSFIANVIHLWQRVSFKDAMMFFTETYEKYVRRELPIEFYRTFDSISAYNLIFPGGKLFQVYDVNNIYAIDISYNLNVMRELYSIMLEDFI